MSQDVRGRRLKKFGDSATHFISSIESDQRLLKHVVKINMAHMLALVKSGEVSAKVGRRCLKLLKEPGLEPRIDREAEDIHELVEQYAVNRLGINVAGFLNLGKSRNDQVATAIRMETRDTVLRICFGLACLQKRLIGVAEKNKKLVLPGYTHLQHAQPVTLVHHLSAYVDAFQRSQERLADFYKRLNLSPMGSAALAGTSIRLDRTFVSKLLGFSGLMENSIDAVSSRDFVLEAVWLATTIMIDLSRLAEELIVWSTKEFDFIEIGDEYTSTSSIMPQKKNPVVAELVRAKTGSTISAFVAVAAILKALPYSYNLDLQEATPHLWRSLSDAEESIGVVTDMLATIKFKSEKIWASIREDGSTATALANELTGRNGISFREAHLIVSELVRLAGETRDTLVKTVCTQLPEVSQRLTCRRIMVSEELAKKLLNHQEMLKSLTSEGSANPKFSSQYVENRKQKVFLTEEWLNQKQSQLREADKSLMNEVEAVINRSRHPN
jgi:argininosuccinate lyase